MKQYNSRKQSSLDDLSREHRKMMEEYGWTAHFVVDDKDFPNRTNYHTHGLDVSFNHPDIQICLPIRPEIAHRLFEAAINHIKAGVFYESGKEYDKILDGGFKVKFIEVLDGDRKLIRMLLPDENGKYEAPLYREQLDTTQVALQLKHRR